MTPPEKSLVSSAKPPRVRIDYDRLREVAKNVSLQAVLLFDAMWQSKQVPTRMVSMAVNKMGYTHGLRSADWQHVPGIVEVRLRYVLQAFRDQQLIFVSNTEWLISYRVPDDFSVSDDAVMADFCVANGQLNAFPYVRQYVQDMTGRGGWPPLVLPTFRAPNSRLPHHGGRRQDG